jgi:hypothetical protein
VPIRTSGEFVGAIVGITPRQTRFLVISSSSGERMMLTAIPTCPDMYEGDQISVRIHDGIAHITTNRSSVSICSLRVIAESDVTTLLPLPPTGAAGRVLHVSEDQTTFTIRLDTAPQPVTWVTNAGPCEGIFEGDRVWLEPVGRAAITHVRVTVPTAACIMRLHQDP